MQKIRGRILYQLEATSCHRQAAKTHRIRNPRNEANRQLGQRLTTCNRQAGAGLLDLGAVGSVALQNLLEMQESENFTQRLLAGALSEVLMVLAARQYVKAWEEEMRATYCQAAWQLHEGFWHISTIAQEDMNPQERTRLVQDLIAPLRDEEVQGSVKAALIVHYYQLLLVAHLKTTT